MEFVENILENQLIRRPRLTPSFLIEGSWKETSWKPSGQRDNQEYLSEFSIMGQLEEDFLEDQRIGRAMDRKIKNTSPSFLLQDSCKKTTWNTNV